MNSIQQQGTSVAVVGATGAVGETLTTLFDERDLPIASLTPVGSARSAGSLQCFRGRDHEIQLIEDTDFSGIDIAFFSAGGDVSLKWARHAAEQGAVVIDNTNAFRMEPDVPLVVPQVNPDRIPEFGQPGIVANPNCSTIPLVRLLQPVHERWHVRRVAVSTYQAASGNGLTGIEELRTDSKAALAAGQGEPGSAFPDGLAFNLVPSIDALLETGFTLEEQKMRQETQKILEDPELDLTATCVRVPVVNGHSEAALIECAEPVERDALVSALSTATATRIHDQHEPGRYPTPRNNAEPDVVHAGRVRVLPHDPTRFWLWVVADNLRIGAALNAVQIAERMLGREEAA